MNAVAPAFIATPDPAPQDWGLTSILVACANNGLGQMVGLALGAEPSVVVATARVSLAGLLAMGPGAFAPHDIIVFEASSTEPDQLDALRAISDATQGRMRFLAMTAEPLSLAQARALLDAGVEEVLPLSAVRPDLRAVVTIDAPDAPAEAPAVPGRQGRVIAVAKARGGIGATTTAINLATLLLAGEKRGPKPKVALLDLDLQHGNAGFYLDVAEHGVFADLIRQGRAPDSAFLAAAMTDHPSGLHVLPAPDEIAPLSALTPAIVGALLDALRAEHDFVVVDMPGPLVEWISPVLARAERLLLVTDTSVPAIRQARRLLDIFLEDRADLPVEVVVNGEKRPFSLTPSQKQAAVVLDRPLTHWIPRDDRMARRAVDQGKALVALAPRSPMARALRRLAASLAPAAEARKAR